MPTAYDYSSGPIAPAALLAAGVHTVMRYVSTPGNPKNITAAEYAELTAAGITVGLVYETTADWMLGGYGAGHAAALSARAQASAAGYPAGHRLWYAADFDASAVQLGVVLGALQGAAAAEGSQALVAAYGGYAVAQAAAAAGYGAPWQTVAWSNGQRSAAAVLYQTGQSTSCAGVQVDVNEITGSLFPTPPTPAQSQEEIDMLIIRMKGAAPVYGLSGGLFWHIADPADLQQYIDAGIKQVTVDAAEIAAIQAAAKIAP